MKVYTTDKIRNVVLLGHGGSGKQRQGNGKQRQGTGRQRQSSGVAPHFL